MWLDNSITSNIQFSLRLVGLIGETSIFNPIPFELSNRDLVVEQYWQLS